MPYLDPFEGLPHIVEFNNMDTTTREGAGRMIAAHNWCSTKYGIRGPYREWNFHGRKFGFKDPKVAVMFKLTWV